MLWVNGDSKEAYKVIFENMPARFCLQNIIVALMNWDWVNIGRRSFERMNALFPLYLVDRALFESQIRLVKMMQGSAEFSRQLPKPEYDLFLLRANPFWFHIHPLKDI